MHIQKIYTPGIAHYAYLLHNGEDAALVDPCRDAFRYLSILDKQGLNLRYIFETHRQEDFEFGSTHLQTLTGAKVVNGQHDCFGRGDIRLRTGDAVSLGDICIKAIHTPGHTPESMSYAVHASKSDAKPWAVFTGDTLFFGDTGRTDLPGKDKQAENAALIYESVHSKLTPLGEQCAIFPAHGAGSVCGSGIADRSSSTIGYEKTYNKVYTMTEKDFVAFKGSEELSRPPYFRAMEELNLRGGRPILTPPNEVAWFNTDELSDFNSNEDNIIIDCREPEAFASAHVENSYAVWLDGLPVFGGWVACDAKQLAIVLARDSDKESAILHLTRVGFDISGVLRGGFSKWRSSGRPLARHGVITPRELAKSADDFQIIDVREADEYAGGHIENAVNIFVGDLAADQETRNIDPKIPTVVTCSVGHRAGLAASILMRSGFQDVRNLLGGMTAWTSLELTTTS